jgi:hypothetical protein
MNEDFENEKELFSQNLKLFQDDLTKSAFEKSLQEFDELYRELAK